MFTKRKDKGTYSTRTASNDCISQRNDNSSAIQLPKGLLDIGPKAVVAWNIDHDIPKNTELFANVLQAHGAPDFATHDTANGEVTSFSRQRQMS